MSTGLTQWEAEEIKASVEPREAIGLTLEESGWLCKAMISNDSFRECILLENPSDVQKRMIALYERLCKINDKLMGKP